MDQTDVLKDIDSPNDVQFEPLIKSNRRIRPLHPNFSIKSKCSSMERLLISTSSRLISAFECLKSSID